LRIKEQETRLNLQEHADAAADDDDEENPTSGSRVVPCGRTDRERRT